MTFEQILYPVLGSLVGYLLHFLLEKAGVRREANEKDSGPDTVLFNHKLVLAMWLAFGAFAALVFVVVKS